LFSLARNTRLAIVSRLAPDLPSALAVRLIAVLTSPTATASGESARDSGLQSFCAKISKDSQA